MYQRKAFSCKILRCLSFTVTKRGTSISMSDLLSVRKLSSQNWYISCLMFTDAVTCTVACCLDDCHSLLHPYWYSYNADMKTRCQSKLINIKALFELTISVDLMEKYMVFITEAPLRLGWWTTWLQPYIVNKKWGDCCSVLGWNGEDETWHAVFLLCKGKPA